MTLALSTPPNGSAITRPSGLTDEQVTLIKRTICKNATDDELQLFISTCNRTRLDPFLGQIWAIKRSEWNAETRQKENKLCIQVGIAGLRLAAERSGQYEGQESPQWCGEDGVWKDIWLSDKPPVAARVAVWRTGFRVAMCKPVTYRSRVQTKADGKPNSFWERDPAGQLAKCAEAASLKAAFPDQLKGMDVIENGQPIDVEAVTVTESLHDDQPMQLGYAAGTGDRRLSNSGRINELFKNLGIESKFTKEEIGKKILNGRQAKNLSEEELIEVLALIQVEVMERRERAEAQGDDVQEAEIVQPDLIPQGEVNPGREKPDTFKGVSVG